MSLLAIGGLEGVIGFNHDNWLIRGLLLILEVGLLEDLVVDYPVVVDYPTLLAALVCQHSYYAFFFWVLFSFLGLCLFAFAKERVQTWVFTYISLILSFIQVVFRECRLQRSPRLVLELSLSLENVDFFMESIAYLLLFTQIQRSVDRPRDLRIRKIVHVWQFWFKFYFSFVHASFSYVHFLVTFISVRIKLVLSAFRDCLAVRILPVIPLLSSPFRLLVDYDLGFGSIMEGLLGTFDAMGVFYEYWCSVDKFYFQAILFMVFLFFFVPLATSSGCFFRELRKVLWSKIY